MKDYKVKSYEELERVRKLNEMAFEPRFNELNKELEKNPDSVELLYEMAMFLCEEARQSGRAIQYFARAMELEPKNSHFPYLVRIF